MDPFNAMRENEKGLLKLMLLQPPTVPEDTCGEATIRIKLNMPNLASPGVWHRFFYVFGLRWKYWWRWCWLILLGRTMVRIPISWDAIHLRWLLLRLSLGMVLEITSEKTGGPMFGKTNWIGNTKMNTNDLNPTMGLKKHVSLYRG